MAPPENFLRRLLTAFHGHATPPRRRTRRAVPMLSSLEDRAVLSHFGGFHHHMHQALNSQTAQTGTAGSTSASNTALETARQTLRTDVQAIELTSGTTVAELTAIRSSSDTLSSDGLSPSSPSALRSFEDGLVKSFAGGTTLTGNADLLAQFEALYTASPTAQHTTDLTAAYDALAAAVTSSNITAAQLATIDADQAAVLAAQGGTSTATFPYFSLISGHGGGFGGGCR